MPEIPEVNLPSAPPSAATVAVTEPAAAEPRPERVDAEQSAPASTQSPPVPEPRPADLPPPGDDDVSGQYLRRVQTSRTDSALERLRNLAEKTEPDSPEARRAKAIAEAEESPPAWYEEVARGVGSGLGRFADEVTDTLIKAVTFGHYDADDVDAALAGTILGEQIELPETTSLTGDITRDITQFVAGFLPLAKAVKAAGVTNTFVRGTIAGTAADVLSFDEADQRLSNLVNQYPGLHKPVTAYLRADPTDGFAEAKFKQGLEGLVLGVAVDGLFTGVRFLKRGMAEQAKRLGITDAPGAAGARPRQAEGLLPLENEGLRRRAETPAAAARTAGDAGSPGEAVDLGLRQHPPETAVPETAVPEQAVPEQAVPEQAAPETAVPETGVQAPVGRAAAAGIARPTPVPLAKPVRFAGVRITDPDLAAEITPPAPKPKGPSLLQFLREQGGIAEDAGELRSRDLGKSRPGLIRKAGLKLDDAALAAQEAGYIGRHVSSGERATPDDLLAAVDLELSGQRQHPHGEGLDLEGGRYQDEVREIDRELVSRAHADGGTMSAFELRTARQLVQEHDLDYDDAIVEAQTLDALANDLEGLVDEGILEADDVARRAAPERAGVAGGTEPGPGRAEADQGGAGVGGRAAATSGPAADAAVPGAVDSGRPAGVEGQAPPPRGPDASAAPEAAPLPSPRDLDVVGDPRKPAFSRAEAPSDDGLIARQSAKVLDTAAAEARGEPDPFSSILGFGEGSRVGNINLANIGGSDDIRGLIKSLGEEIPIEKTQRQGTEEALGLARLLAEDPDKTVRRFEVMAEGGRGFTRQEILASKLLLNRTTETLLAQARKIAAKGGDDVEKFAFKRTIVFHNSVQRVLSDQAREAGRALQAFRTVTRDQLGCLI